MRIQRPIAMGLFLASAASFVACSDEPVEPAEGAEGADDRPPALGPASSGSATGSARLLAEAQRMLGSVKQSSYSHVTQVDEGAGVFVFDCSGFVNYALARVVPEAFTALARATAPRPVAKSYVTFVSALATPTKSWRAVARARDLVPGDIVAWLKPAAVESTNTGHMMIVADSVRVGGSEVIVPIIDATESGHGKQDVRTSTKATGLGRGTTVLLVDPAGAPTGYRWSTDAVSKPLTTKVALAHLE